jgi:hypothetical protein
MPAPDTTNFNSPLSLYSCLLTRAKAIRQALELKRRREQSHQHLAERKAEHERLIYNDRKDRCVREDVGNT